MADYKKEYMCATTIAQDPSISGELCSALPNAPFDGQVFIDANNIKWSWNEKEEVWVSQGASITLPPASSSSSGLMTASQKLLMDATPKAGGGFGVITHPLILQSDTNVDGITQGNIVFCSDSLSITCRDARDEIIQEQCGVATSCDVEGVTPGMVFNVSDVFLDTLCFEASGPEGPRGTEGNKGDKGTDGFKDSPQGADGLSGRDATEGYTLKNVRIIEVDEVVDFAIVDATLDSDSARLSYTTSKMNTAENDEPADQLITKPIVRNLYYPTVADDPTCYLTLDDWRLDVPLNDPLQDPDVLLFKSSSTAAIGDEVELTTIRLTSFIQSIADFYKACLKTYDDAWLREVCDFISGKDEAARAILASMASKVSECEFDRPIQFCLGVEPGECPEPQKRFVTVEEFQDVLNVNIIPSDPNPSPSPPTPSPGP